MERDQINTLDVVKRRLPAEESGQGLAEYSLILAFIAAVCIIAATALGLAVSAGISSILPGF